MALLDDSSGLDDAVAVAIVVAKPLDGSARRRDVIFFQPRKSIWLRYFGVVNVYSSGLTAEFSGNMKTTNQA